MALYQQVVRHDGLHKYRVIKGEDYFIVQQKAAVQLDAWDEMWKKKLEREQRQLEREKAMQNIQIKELKKREALLRTRDIEEYIEVISNILKHTLNIDDTINWKLLKDRKKFTIKKPLEPTEQKFPEYPDKTNYKYRPKIGFFDYIISSRKQQRINEAENLYKEDCMAWEKNKNRIIKENENLHLQYKQALSNWENLKEEFLKKQKEQNDLIDQRQEQYLKKEPGAIIDYCDMVLSNSEYPDTFPQSYELDFNPENGVFFVDYQLPDIEVIPNAKEIKYVASSNSFKEVPMPESKRNQLYDSLVYQITLRTIHELFEADAANALTSIVFSGYVTSIDKSTGNEVTACIVSIHTNKEEFLEVNLANIEPKACFKKLKGVGSSKLYSLTPIAPVLTMSREDKRFIASYDVSQNIDESFNLATMDWEDFEHLIRELFQEEFSQNGGEVKVTQASRDGGIDAVAFDPDPIRGGKIVIQAKRYTNTVGVSAVRDLYGTVQHEGAMKGILVTTSDYGPDAYEFANGKPITLINGANLLYMLEKYGHKAKIDLKEAKRLIQEQA